MARGRTGHLVLLAVAWIIALFLLLPGLVTIPIAFNDSRFVQMPQGGALSLRHFEAMLSGERWLDSMRQSALIALAASAGAVVIGTACSIGMWRLAGRGAALVSALVLMPAILPPVISGLALYRLFVLLGIYDTVAGVVLAHIIMATPFVVITVTSALSLVDPRLEQASRSLGASTTMTALQVILPNIKSGVLTGAVFAFVISWDEIVVTLFVSSRSVYTLPRRMWDGIRENVDPTVAAVATVLIAATALIVIVALLRAPARGGSEPA